MGENTGDRHLMSRFWTGFHERATEPSKYPYMEQRWLLISGDWHVIICWIVMKLSIFLAFIIIAN